MERKFRFHIIVGYSVLTCLICLVLLSVRFFVPDAPWARNNPGNLLEIIVATGIVCIGGMLWFRLRRRFQRSFSFSEYHRCSAEVALSAAYVLTIVLLVFFFSRVLMPLALHRPLELVSEHQRSQFNDWLICGQVAVAALNAVLFPVLLVLRRVVIQ